MILTQSHSIHSPQSFTQSRELIMTIFEGPVDLWNSLRVIEDASLAGLVSLGCTSSFTGKSSRERQDRQQGSQTSYPSKALGIQENEINRHGTYCWSCQAPFFRNASKRTWRFRGPFQPRTDRIVSSLSSNGSSCKSKCNMWRQVARQWATTDKRQYAFIRARFLPLLLFSQLRSLIFQSLLQRAVTLLYTTIIPLNNTASPT